MGQVPGSLIRDADAVAPAPAPAAAPNALDFLMASTLERGAAVVLAEENETRLMRQRGCVMLGRVMIVDVCRAESDNVG